MTALKLVKGHAYSVTGAEEVYDLSKASTVVELLAFVFFTAYK